ncbi:response regulator transcription factor [Pectinatus sottacetonis]|uniref:response regulator transcription factor n=1 Tax=Pectinatus sottacetonis TaxID=1002795 RepID=UPI0018C71F83|nr:response regulator transcription factor [Pectinatus sottacetonis]
MKILLAEDDNKLSKMLAFLLRKEGYSVDTVDNGEDAINYADVVDYDIVLLDWMMPQQSGLDVCASIRNKGKNCGVIMLTAKDTLDDKIAGLENGADDYVVKPFEFPELLARIRAVMRRQNKKYENDIVYFSEGLAIDRGTYTAYFNDNDLQLTKKEFQLLNILLQHKGTTLPREQIIDYIWSSEKGITSNALDALIKLLRKKLADAGVENIIKTVHGIGYRIEG